MKLCTVANCTRPHRARGMCVGHYEKWRDGIAGPCSIAGCNGRVSSAGLCVKHYSRQRKYGDPLAPFRRAPSGTGHINDSGYRVFNDGTGPKREHILVAERALGKPLPKGAVVHHVNGVRDDNRPENLVICPDHAYHRMIHKREEAMNAGQPAHYRRCTFCRQWDEPENLARSSQGVTFHRACRNADLRAKAARRVVSEAA